MAYRSAQVEMAARAYRPALLGSLLLRLGKPRFVSLIVFTAIIGVNVGRSFVKSSSVLCKTDRITSPYDVPQQLKCA